MSQVKEVDVGSKHLVVSSDIKDVAEQVMDEENLDLSPATIQYVEVWPNISKTRVAKVVKSNKELKLFSGSDYIVEISGDIWDSLFDDEETRKRLVYQQLLRIAPTYKEKSGEWKFKKQKPDIVTFKKIHDNYGLEWIDRVVESVSSIHDLDPEKKHKITF